jgi:hypothetical protein
VAFVRIRIVQKPPVNTIDGLRLDLFEVGGQYDIGTMLASVLLAEGWAEPVTEAPAFAGSFDIFSADGLTYRQYGPPAPPNLIRETYPPYYDGPPGFALDRRRRPRNSPRA